MRFLFILSFCCVARLAGGEQEISLTLDPAEMEQAKQAVFGSPSMSPSVAGMAAPEATATEQRWLQAMAAAGTDMMSVMLLALLQELNPRATMSACAADYAAALELHRLAAAGNTVACQQLATAFRTGVLPSGLLFLRCGELAEKMSHRAVFYQSTHPNK